MKCPSGHEGVHMKSPDYGRGSEWVCYQCDSYGRRWVDTSEEARAASEAGRARSRANAEAARRADKP